MMSRQKNQHEVQAFEYNLLAKEKNGKNMNNSSLIGQKQILENKFQSQKQNSNGNQENNFAKYKQISAIQNTVNMKDTHLTETTTLNKSQYEEQKINDAKQMKDDLQIVNVSSRLEVNQENNIQQENSFQQEDDDDEVEIEIVSYECSSDDQSKLAQDNDEINKQQKEKRQQVNGINQSQTYRNGNKQSQKDVEEFNKLNLNSQLENELNEKEVNNPPKSRLIKELNVLNNRKKGDRSQNSSQLQNVFQIIQNNDYSKTRNRSNQRENTKPLQRQQQTKLSDEQKKKSIQNQQISSKKQIEKAVSSQKQGYNGDNEKQNNRNINDKKANDYQNKYLTSRKKNEVTDPQLESPGLYKQRRIETKPNSLNYKERESLLQNDDYEDYSDETDDNQKGNRGRQQVKNNNKTYRNNDNTNQRIYQSQSNRKKIELNSNGTDDESNSIDITVTLTKEQQSELLKYHKKSKNYHGTAKQFGITHEEARHIVKKLKKSSKTTQNN